MNSLEFTQSLRDSLFIGSIIIAAISIAWLVSTLLRNYEIRHELKKLKKWRKFSEIEKAQKHEEYDKLAAELAEERAFNDTQGDIHVRLMLKYAAIKEASEKTKAEVEELSAERYRLACEITELKSKLERKRNERGQFVKSEPDRDWTTATKEELLAEAKRRYPVGTKFIELCTDIEDVAEKEAYFYYFPEKFIAVRQERGVIYRHGKWAKIIPNA